MDMDKWSVFLLIELTTSQFLLKQYHVKIGMLFTNGPLIDKNVGFEGSAGAVNYAVQVAEGRGWLNNVNVTYVWYSDNADEANATGFASQMIYVDQVDAIFGPVTPDAIAAVGALANYNNVPHFVWGKPMDYALSQKLPTSAPMAGTTYGTMVSLIKVFNRFKWEDLAFLYLSTVDPLKSLPYCDDVAGSLEPYLAAHASHIGVQYFRQITDNTPESYKRMMEAAATSARIIVLCFDVKEDKRNFMLTMSEEGRISAEYLYLFLEGGGTGYGNPPAWIGSDGRDEEAKRAFKRTLVIDKQATMLSPEYNARVTEGATKWPFLCDYCSGSGNASALGVYLGDSVLVYLGAVNRTIKENSDSLLIGNLLKNADTIFNNMPLNTTGIENATMIMNPSTHVRSAPYSLYGIDRNGEQVLWDVVDSSSKTFNAVVQYTSTEADIFAHYGGVVPRNEPLCGYLHNKCPLATWVVVVAGAAGVFGFLLLLIALCSCVICFKRSQRERLNALWQINYLDLARPDKQETKSQRSLLSQGTSLATFESREFENVSFLYYRQAPCVVRRLAAPARFDARLEAELRQMRTLDHAHLNRFVGLAAAGNALFQVWRWCERGSIEDVLEEHRARIDGHIMLSMIKSIAEGIYYIHNSTFHSLGVLNTDSCLVDDRFQVKLQYYGMNAVKEAMPISTKTPKCLFYAPERLRNPAATLCGTQPDDIYAFAILAAMILTRGPLWGAEADAEAEWESVAERVKRGAHPPERPSLRCDEPSLPEAEAELRALLPECWAENPARRPDARALRDRLRPLSAGPAANLMDHMFALMEGSAADLELEVQQRSAELVEEQRKADRLLHRMMPREAVDLLRRGEPVRPQLFPSATCFFSDVVGFTALSSRSTPLQVIDFLNRTYSMADDLIAEHDVYKVETIGDGLHCVSGIPVRNADNHVREIVDLALAFREAVRRLRLPHLPQHRVQMRFGVHSGPCVTGVVGVTAPRYCVFGDTVHLAAKMESSGRPGMVHVSPASKQLIDTCFPHRYQMVPRGETFIKAYGLMSTFWALLPGEPFEVEDDKGRSQEAPAKLQAQDSAEHTKRLYDEYKEGF